MSLFVSAWINSAHATCQSLCDTQMNNEGVIVCRIQCDYIPTPPITPPNTSNGWPSCAPNCEPPPATWLEQGPDPTNSVYTAEMRRIRSDLNDFKDQFLNNESCNNFFRGRVNGGLLDGRDVVNRMLNTAGRLTISPRTKNYGTSGFVYAEFGSERSRQPGLIVYPEYGRLPREFRLGVLAHEIGHGTQSDVRVAHNLDTDTYRPLNTSAAPVGPHEEIPNDLSWNRHFFASTAASADRYAALTATSTMEYEDSIRQACPGIQIPRFVKEGLRH